MKRADTTSAPLLAVTCTACLKLFRSVGMIIKIVADYLGLGLDKNIIYRKPHTINVLLFVCRLALKTNLIKLVDDE